MESKYLNFPLGVKAIAFIPSLAGFVVFIVLIVIYGRVKPTKSDPYGGRLVKKPKSKQPKLGIFSIARMKLLGRRNRGSFDPNPGTSGNSNNNNSGERVISVGVTKSQQYMSDEEGVDTVDGVTTINNGAAV